MKNKIVYDIGLGEFDHYQKNRNGQRENGISVSSDVGDQPYGNNKYSLF